MKRIVSLKFHSVKKKNHCTVYRYQEYYCAMLLLWYYIQASQSLCLAAYWLNLKQNINHVYDG